MPVNDPFGPSVYVPDLNAGANSASQGWATGISNLGKALFPDPNALADARYKNQQTQQLQAAGQARSAIASALTGGDPNRFADPTFRNNFIANWAQLPAEEQNAQRSTLGTIIANTNMSGADQDQFLSHAGITNYTQTPSGVNAALANQIKTAQIGAGATIGAAQIGANATTTAATTAASGHIIGTQTEVAGRQQIADDTMVNVITPTGVQSITNKEARDGGYTRVPPNASTSDIATIMVQHEQPGQTPLVSRPASHGVSPSPAVTQPQTGADGQPVAPAVSPGTAATQAITKVSGTNVPKENPDVTLQRIANADLPTSIYATGPNDVNKEGHYIVGPKLAAAVIGRAAVLAADRSQPQFYGNQQAAMAQAYSELVTPIKTDTSKLVFNTGYNRFGMNDMPSVDFAPNYVPAVPAPITPLRPNAPPAPAATTAPPAPALPPSNRSAIPVPNPAPAPAPAPPPRPPKPKPPTAKPPAAPAAPAPPPAPPAPAAQPAATAPSLGDIPPAMRKPGVVFHGSIFKGGSPTDGSNWQVATPAEIANAKQNGLFAQ